LPQGLFGGGNEVKPTTAGSMERVSSYLQQMAEAQGVPLPSETESLFDAGVLDSFGLLEFVGFIEGELNIQIPDDDLVAGNFTTIAKIRAYLRDRIGE
jgi:acyl carrier protein